MNEWEWQLLEDKTTVDRISIAGTEVRAGDRVRLHPRKGGDVFDIALDGQIAHIESIEQDYEGKNHVCVVLEEDPGRDLGLLRQPGHRFFFDAAEIEPLPPHESQPTRMPEKERILVAGIGNIFLGDDGFGVEVIRRLAARSLPTGVRVADFGIRGFDLAYALQDGYETVILVDAYPHGKQPGTISLVEPDLSNLNQNELVEVETHGMNPLNVLRMAAGMSANRLPRILLVGCEPATLGGEEGTMGLSEPLEAALDQAVKMIEEVVERLLQERKKNEVNEGKGDDYGRAQQ
jgi:hydrogenase maturation protease